MASNKNPPTVIAFDSAFFDDSTCIKQIDTIANVRPFNLIVVYTHHVPLVCFVMNTFEFEVISLVLLEFIPNYLQVG